MRNILDKSIEKMKMHVLCEIIFFANHVFYVIKQKNVAKNEGPQMTPQCGAYARCMLDKQGYTHARACTLPLSWAHAITRARANI